jgi:hypothetical protein
MAVNWESTKHYNKQPKKNLFDKILFFLKNIFNLK